MGLSNIIRLGLLRQSGSNFAMEDVGGASYYR